MSVDWRSGVDGRRWRRCRIRRRKERKRSHFTPVRQRLHVFDAPLHCADIDRASYRPQDPHRHDQQPRSLVFPFCFLSSFRSAISLHTTRFPISSRLVIPPRISFLSSKSAFLFESFFLLSIRFHLRLRLHLRSALFSSWHPFFNTHFFRPVI